MISLAHAHTTHTFPHMHTHTHTAVELKSGYPFKAPTFRFIQRPNRISHTKQQHSKNFAGTRVGFQWKFTLKYIKL